MVKTTSRACPFPHSKRKSYVLLYLVFRAAAALPPRSLLVASVEIMKNDPSTTTNELTTSLPFSLFLSCCPTWRQFAAASKLPHQTHMLQICCHCPSLLLRLIDEQFLTFPLALRRRWNIFHKIDELRILKVILSDKLTSFQLFVALVWPEILSLIPLPLITHTHTHIHTPQMQSQLTIGAGMQPNNA